MRTYFWVHDPFVRAGKCCCPALAHIRLLCSSRAQRSCPVSSQLLLSAFPQQIWEWHKCYYLCGPLWDSFSTLISSEFCVTSITRLFPASSFCSCFSTSSLRYVTGDSEHLSIRLMKATSCATPQSPLILRLPGASLTAHASVTPAPGWTSKAPGDGFGQGATTSHLRGGQLGNLCWKINSPCCMC